MMLGRRMREFSRIGVLAALVSAGCGMHASSGSGGGLAPGRAPSASAGARPVTAADDARACGPPAEFPRGTADEIMAGRLTVAPFAAVTIDPRRDGRIDWSLDPYHHPTWRVYYRSGGWVEALTERYLAGGPGAGAYRDRARILLRGWLRDVPIQQRDPSTLICAAGAFPAEHWIDDEIPRLVDYYAGHWMGAWNHGLKQDLEILRIGCGYPPGAFGGRARKWRSVALRQMAAAFGPNRLGPAVDAQGATNEQSTGYASFVYRLYRTAQRRLAACGMSLPNAITSRVARMPEFIAQATQPDGKLVQIGDTYADAPDNAPGSPPRQRVAVYRAGYIFGRSGWGTSRPFGSESFYSLRFGPGRQVHGHNDHMSVTYFARGRNLIVDSGHTGYETTPYRAYLRSPEAHNVLVMPGVPFSPAAATPLIQRSIGADGQFFEFADAAFGGHRRVRSVYTGQRPDLMLVFDRASGAARYQQLWHLDPGLTVVAVGRSYAVATAPGTRLLISQVRLPGQVIPAGSTRVIRGQTRPYQGWVSRAMLQRTPAPVISMTRGGPSVAMLTLIVPGGPGTTVTAKVTGRPDGRYEVGVRIGRTFQSFLVSPGGDIERG